MRIAFMLLHDFKFAGWSLNDFLGRHHFSKEYCRRLAGRGHDVTLYMLHHDAASAESLELDGYRIKVFPVQFSFPPLPRFGNAHNLQVTKELGRERPDVVHFNHYYLWTFPYVARWAERRGVGVVCQYHGASDRLRRVRKAFVRVYRGVDRYLVAKDGEMAYLEGSIGIQPQRIVKFPNVGVDTAIFKPSGEKSPEPSLLYVGRIPLRSRNLGEKSPWRLLEMMGELVKSLPEATLHVVGDGPGMGGLREAAMEEGVERNVIFHGYLDNSLLPPIYSRSWATMIPLHLDSIDPYWDGSLKESLACGTPVVGFSESVTCPDSGLQRLGCLVPPKPRAAAAAISEVLSDRGRLRDMGEAGRAEVARCCSWDSVIAGLERVYGSLH